MFKFRLIYWLAILLVCGMSTRGLRAADDPATNVDHGQVLFRQGDYVGAAPLLRSGLDAIDAQKLDEATYLGRCLTPLVEIYVRTEQFAEALPLAERQLRW